MHLKNLNFAHGVVDLPVGDPVGDSGLPIRALVRVNVAQLVYRTVQVSEMHSGEICEELDTVSQDKAGSPRLLLGPSYLATSFPIIFQTATPTSPLSSATLSMSLFLR